MSDTESTPQPRRSQRDKKSVSRLGQGECGSRKTVQLGNWCSDSPLKRKRGNESEDDALSDLTEPNDLDVAMDDIDEDDGPDYKAPSKPSKQGRRRASPVKPKTAAPKKPRARKQKGAVDTAQVAKETHISDDNALFSEYH